MTAATTNSYLKIISMITAASEHNVGSITEKRDEYSEWDEYFVICRCVLSVPLCAK